MESAFGNMEPDNRSKKWNLKCRKLEQNLSCFIVEVTVRVYIFNEAREL